MDGVVKCLVLQIGGKSASKPTIWVFLFLPPNKIVILGVWHWVYHIN